MDYKKKMTNVFRKQVIDLENILPNFKIANAIIHYDETSPHLHIIGVPIKYKNKNGMKKQVGKSEVFTKEALTKLQDKMRILCIDAFNKEYGENYKLKTKMKGRNKDYHVTEMDNYQRMKNNIEVHQKDLNHVKEKTDNLLNNTKEIRGMLENLKSKGLIKNQLVIDVENRDKVLVFIDLVDKTIVEYQNVQDLSVTLKEVGNELFGNRERIKLLSENNEDLNLKVNKLSKKVAELEKENQSLKTILQKIKKKFYSIIHYLTDRIIMSKDKEKYKEFANELYEHGALETDDFKLLQDNNNLDNHKELEIEKDDIEK